VIAMASAITPARQLPSFGRVLLVLAATVVMAAGMRVGAPILNPILFAVVLSLIFSPVYSACQRTSPDPGHR
jgi:predicted PurR-regulated permease PerM